MLRKASFKTLANEKKPMSLEKSSQQLSLKLPQQVVHSVSSTRVHFVAKQAFGDKADASLLWNTTLVAPPGMRKRFIVFKNIEYVISNWSGDQFPSCIYLTVDGVAGYFDSALLTTTRVAALQLSVMNAVMDESAVRTYDLKYVLRDSVTWEVPLAMTDVKVRVQIDGAITAVILPLPNPLTVNLEIRTQ